MHCDYDTLAQYCDHIESLFTIAAVLCDGHHVAMWVARRIINLFA